MGLSSFSRISNSSYDLSLAALSVGSLLGAFLGVIIVPEAIIIGAIACGIYTYTRKQK